MNNKTQIITIVSFSILAAITAGMSAGQPGQSDQTAEPTVSDNSAKLPDPNAPEKIYPTPAVPLHPESDPNAPLEATWEPPEKYWQPHYHHQVNQRTFMILNFPYHYGGKAYPIAKMSDSGLYDNEVDPNAITPETPKRQATDVERTRYALENAYELIHQWRCINASPDAALEIVRSVELTRRSSGIYDVEPKLAIEVKRTIGQIGLINRHFDSTSRITVETIIAGRSTRSVMSRMKKLLADLTAQMERLIDQNDQISVALGIGKINRQLSSESEKEIKFANIAVISQD